MTLARVVDGSQARPTISFELFPPRTPAARETVHATVAALADALPDFFSVTYGASGATRESSAEVLRHVLASTPVAAMAHLTCVGASRAEVIDVAASFLDAGVRNILALRGDPPPGQPWTPHADGVHRACDLVELLQVVERHRVARGRVPAQEATPLDAGPLSLAVAAFPTGERGSDLVALRAKQDAGAHFAITQVCYDAGDYSAFVARARAAGVTIPLLPGIVPMTDLARLTRLEALTGVALPARVRASLSAAAERGPTAAYDEGIIASALLARGLVDAGAPGVHLYTFNVARSALDVLDAAQLHRAIPSRVPAPTPPPRSAPSALPSPRG